MKTIFQKIIDGELPSKKAFENERILVIHDISPAAPVHLLIISKKVIHDISHAEKEDGPLLAEMMFVAAKMAKQLGVADGFRLVTNNGPSAGQTIFHLHFHLLGGEPLGPMT